MASYESVLKTTKKRTGISAIWLKLLALLCMSLDHFAVIIIKNGKLYGFSEEYYALAIATEEGQRWLRLYHILRPAGRLAFPIFAFLLVEGFIHTSDFWPYFFRVLLMAIVAEVPYDLAFYNATYNFEAQNVGFTLATGLLVMYGMQMAGHRTEWKWSFVVAGCALAELLYFEYGALGVLMMALLYTFWREKALRMASGAVLSAINSREMYCLGALAFVPIFFYNGERGRFHFKWFFYLYYPLHLAVMYAMIYIGAMITE